MALFSGWIQPCPSKPHKALCKICHSELKAHKAVLCKHAKSPDHIEKCKAEGVVTELPKYLKSTSSQQKEAELVLAAYVAEHAALSSVDHLGKLLSKRFSDSPTMSNLKLHRKKCTYLITNVIAPCLHKELVQDVVESDTFFSLVVDESTDVACQKSLGIVIRYFSKVLKTVVTTLYCLLGITNGDAQTQVDTIKKQLEYDGLPMARMIGIGVDGANVNVGSHHSISTLLRSEIPHLITFKCVCHSLHLAASKAMDILPRHLEVIVRDTCSWFSFSSKRQAENQMLYETLFDGKSPLKIGKVAETRWLSRFEIVKKILSQWDALQLHFQIAGSNERCYTAEELYGMYSDIQNKVYFTFLLVELESITKLNRAFQSETADVTKLFNDLNTYYYSVLQKIISPSDLRSFNLSNLSGIDFSSYTMPPSAMHLGYAANLIIDQAQLSPQVILKIKEVCFRFLKELANQLRKRLPENFFVLKNLDMLSPKNATSQMKNSILPFASNFSSVVPNLDQLEKEWMLLQTRTWTKTNNVISFWSEVKDAQNADGEPTFGNISKFALSVLALPFSNAAVERTFSRMNAVKSKLRNRLLLKTTNAILQIRSGLAWKKEDCCSFEPSKEMIKKFNVSMYEKTEHEMVGRDIPDPDDVDEILHALGDA